MLIPARNAGFGFGAWEQTKQPNNHGRASGDSFLALGGGVPWRNGVAWETVFWRSEGRACDAVGASRGNYHTCSGIGTFSGLGKGIRGSMGSSGGLWGSFWGHFGVTLWVMNFTQVCRNWTKIQPLKSSRRALARGDNERLWNLHLIWVFDEKLKQT